MDPEDRFAYLFPFYRIDIDSLWLKLDKIKGVPTPAHLKPQTQFVNIYQLKEAFSDSPAWREGWPNMERLLRAPELKSLVSK